MYRLVSFLILVLIFLFDLVLRKYILQAASFASMPEIWSKWSPPQERSTLVSYSFTGVYFGLTVSYPIAGFVAKAWGWPSIFYVTGKPYKAGGLQVLILKACAKYS